MIHLVLIPSVLLKGRFEYFTKTIMIHKFSIHSTLVESLGNVLVIYCSMYCDLIVFEVVIRSHLIPSIGRAGNIQNDFTNVV